MCKYASIVYNSKRKKSLTFKDVLVRRITNHNDFLDFRQKRESIETGHGKLYAVQKGSKCDEKRRVRKNETSLLYVFLVFHPCFKPH